MSNFDIDDLKAAEAYARQHAIRPWTNPDTGKQFYLAYVHPARIAALPARTRWKILQHQRRHARRYGFPLLPESVIIELAAQMEQEKL